MMAGPQERRGGVGEGVLALLECRPARTVLFARSPGKLAILAKRRRRGRLPPPPSPPGTARTIRGKGRLLPVPFRPPRSAAG